MNGPEQPATDPADSGGGLTPAAAVAAGALAAAITVPTATVPAQAAPASAVGLTTGATPTAAHLKQQRESGPGAAKMAYLCGDATDGICTIPNWSEDHLTFDAVVIGRVVAAEWPAVAEVGGWRPSDPYPDHPSGRAVDVMMPNGGTGKDKALGNEIAEYFKEHADEYGVEYILWRQQQWSADGPKKWRPMADRGSATANHMDHVHITVKGNKNTMAKKLIADLPAVVVSDATDAAGPGADGSSALPIGNGATVTETIVIDTFAAQSGRNTDPDA